MGKKYLGNLRIGFVSVIMFFALSLLVSCGNGGGDDGAPSVGSITVNAGAPEIVANGVTSTWITATLSNSAGEPVDDDTTVVFTTTAGALSPASAKTYDGMATVYLRSSTTVGTATVTATAAGASSSTVVTFIAGPVSVISLTATPSILNADGESSSTIRAEVSDANNNAVDGEVISFTLDSGSGAFSAPTVTTVGGVATVTFTASKTPGPAVIRASSTNNTFSTISITLMGGGDPVGEEFGAFPAYLNISGLWRMNLEDQISVGLADVYGNAVKDGTIVDFKTYNTGGFITPTKAETTSGFASTSLFSTPNPVPMQGFLSVTSETAGGPTTRVTAIEVTPFPDNYIVYLGTNGGGIYKSTDSGQTWENISRSTLNSRSGQNFIDPYIKGHSAICVDPDDHNAVYAGTGYGGRGNVFRSLDGGMNWNSDNLEEWGGLYMYTPDAAIVPAPPSADVISNAAVLTVLCDGDDNPATDHPYVWIGTEGKGFLYAADGEIFQPSGGIVTTPIWQKKSGSGYVTEPTLWYSSQTETWTVTCNVPEDSYATEPVPGKDNAGDGGIKNLETSLQTKTEDWTVTFKASVETDGFFPVDGDTARKPGFLSDITINEARSETWTVICDNDTDGAEVFNIFRNGGDYVASIGIDEDYEGEVSFSVNDSPGSDPWLKGDRFSFSISTYWLVSGTVSGTQTNTAKTDDDYTSDGNEVRFHIYEVGDPFSVGDYFTFSTIAASSPFWIVEGSVSGIQSGIAQMGQLYRSDNNEVSFMIVEGSTPFATGDSFRFGVTANNINHGRTVWDIERIAGTHGAGAILYAGTSTGVFRSINGGRTWTETGNFTGDYVICLEVHPASTGGAGDVIYAGTQNGAVWVSTNSGISWTQYSSGISAGSFIKDIVLDPTNNFLYAITYQGPVEAAAGAVYAHAINANGSMKTGGWKKVSTGLGVTALHAMEIDNPADPGVLFTGGEGINFSRSVTDLATGNPTWIDSGDGLSNLIMARMPILFSGQCTMIWDITRYDNTVWFKVYIEDQNGNPPIDGSKFEYTVSGAYAEEFSYDYNDTYTNIGTFRDPGNPSTNNPYRFEFTISPPKSAGEEPTVDVELTFTPANTLPGAPGSSGQEQTYKWTFAYQ